MKDTGNNTCRFTYVETRQFNGCTGCPFNRFHGDDLCTDHDECEETGGFIRAYTDTGIMDFRNSDGVLDGCPFLKSSTIRQTVKSSEI